MTLFLYIIVSIYDITISWQIIYGAYLNENFYLLKINKPPPKIYNDTAIINFSISKSVKELILKNLSEN